MPIIAPSIFNDVIGPVMVGPSSSHTAGPARLGFLAGQFVQPEELTSIEIFFDPAGSFAATYKGQKSDQGFVAGLLGYTPDDKRLNHALDLAKEQKREITFSIATIEAEHPNTAIIVLTSKDNTRIKIRGLSIGGGAILIDRINDCPVHIGGDFFEILIFMAAKTDLENHSQKGQNFLERQGITIQKTEVWAETSDSLMAKAIINYRLHSSLPQELIDRLTSEVGGVTSVQLTPVLPVLSSASYCLPFSNAQTMLLWCNKNNKKLWEAALHYESIRGSIPQSDVFSMMYEIAKTMEITIQEGLQGNFVMQGSLSPSAHRLQQSLENHTFVPSGILDSGIVFSTAVMELNSSMGRIVAAPTAGSCGILPGAIFGLLAQRNMSHNEKLKLATKALLTAGIIGVFIAGQATFAAEQCGCQAECGSAATMAAAALTELSGGTIEQACMAASLAMQNSLGLICDPVAEQVEIPCIGRNAGALGNAVTSANMAILGFTGILPLDEVIQAMWEVGNALPVSLRCTGKGGLCITPTAKRIKEELNQKNNSIST